VRDRCIALGVEDNGAYRSGPSQERGAQRYHCHAVAFGRVEPLFFCLLDTAYPGMQHGDGHEQNQDTAANPEGPNRYSEEAKDGIACKQDNNENDSHGDTSHEAVFVADPFSLIVNHRNKINRKGEIFSK